jgi:hypothetical protein
MNKKTNNSVDVATIAADSKIASGFGALDLSRDTAIPYITILQSGSPQINHQKQNTLKQPKLVNCTIQLPRKPFLN